MPIIMPSERIASSGTFWPAPAHGGYVFRFELFAQWVGVAQITITER
jgi:hypothetical protein